jgi:hypothetical protein
MATIHVRRDKERGCGWRKEGGTYLVSGGISVPCGRLPVIVEKCPCCGGGIKPSRGYTWIDPRKLLEGHDCAFHGKKGGLWDMDRFCRTCPLHPGKEPEKAGLLWVGGKFYPTPEDWMKEAKEQGVSRRIPAVPKGFKVGETWVLVAHREAIKEACPDCQGEGGGNGGHLSCDTCKNTGEIFRPAIFHAFLPQAIEYVVKEGDSEEKLNAMEERGITCIKVERDES